MYGVSYGADATLNFSWTHNVPADIAHYTIKEMSGPPISIATGVEYDVPFTYQGNPVENLTHSEVIVVPVEVETLKCYRVSATDVNENESGDSDEACATILIEDTVPPSDCTNFNVEFNVAPE